MTNTITRHQVIYDGGPGTGEWFRIDSKYTDGDNRALQGQVAGGGTVTLEGTTRENIGGPQFGTDLIDASGDFLAGAWIYTPNWSFADGVATSDGSQAAAVNLTQANSGIQVGFTYTLAFDIANYVSGSVTPYLSGTAGTLRSANGSYSELLVAGSQFHRLSFLATADFIGDLQNVSLKLEVPAEDIDALQQYNTDFTDVLNSTWTYVRATLDAGTARVQGSI
jgi:hypothetical protein